MSNMGTPVPSRPMSAMGPPVPGTQRRQQLEVLTALDQAKTQYYHFTAIVIAGMGFFTDAYDLFCISVVTKLLGRIYYPEDHLNKRPGQLPINVLAAVNGTALCGTLAGQIWFGWLGDKLGRKKVYGITLAMMIVFSVASGLSFGKSSHAVMATLCFCRFWLGFGIGGDYPLSATIMSEYANTKTRGAFIAAVFAMQGFGILTAGAVGVILSLIFNKAYPAPAWRDDPTHSTPHEVDALWRLIVMFGAIPAAATYYYRMKMPETARYTALVLGNAKKAAVDMTKVLDIPETALTESSNVGRNDQEYKLFSTEFLRRHGLHLLGTTTTWFILDVAYYSQNLFQNQIFRQIGWTPAPSTLNAVEEVYHIAKAQCTIALFSTVPGYWFTVALVDRIGRFVIQLQGFIFMTIFMFAIAIPYARLTDGSKSGLHIFLALYALTFFFSNFGPNATTFIVPAELFPARLRATCHGISAACGKAGAIVGAFGFLFLSQPTNAALASPYKPGIGLRSTFLILAALNACGAAFTFLVPETSNKSLEDLTGESDFRGEESKGDATGLKAPKSPFYPVEEGSQDSTGLNPPKATLYPTVKSPYDE